MSLSEHRILIRIRPSWATNTLGRVKPRLKDRLAREVLPLYRMSRESGGLKQLSKCVNNLVELLDKVETHGHVAGKQRLDLFKSITQTCFQISQLGTQKDLAPKLEQSRAFVEVRKIGRYMAICEDLVAFRYKKTYQRISGRLQLDICQIAKSPSPFPKSHVHAEVQLVLYYDQHLATASKSICRPRVLGCSKGACYLCFQFIRRHGGFHLDSTHGRLHPKWTIPCPAWMSKKQVKRYREIVRGMTKELNSKISAAQQRKLRRSLTMFPIESKVNLPPMTPSLLSEVAISSPKLPLNPVLDEPILPLEVPPSQIVTYREPAGSVSTLVVPETCLPYAQDFLTPPAPFTLQLGDISLITGFGGARPKRLVISEVSFDVVRDRSCPIVQIGDILTGDGTSIERNSQGSHLHFLLEYGREKYLKVEVSWEESNTAC